MKILKLLTLILGCFINTFKSCNQCVFTDAYNLSAAHFDISMLMPKRTKIITDFCLLDQDDSTDIPTYKHKMGYYEERDALVEIERYFPFSKDLFNPYKNLDFFENMLFTIKLNIKKLNEFSLEQELAYECLYRGVVLGILVFYHKIEKKDFYQMKELMLDKLKSDLNQLKTDLEIDKDSPIRRIINLCFQLISGLVALNSREIRESIEEERMRESMDQGLYQFYEEAPYKDIDACRSVLFDDSLELESLMQYDYQEWMGALFQERKEDQLKSLLDWIHSGFEIVIMGKLEPIEQPTKTVSPFPEDPVQAQEPTLFNVTIERKACDNQIMRIPKKRSPEKPRLVQRIIPVLKAGKSPIKRRIQGSRAARAIMIAG